MGFRDFIIICAVISIFNTVSTDNIFDHLTFEEERSLVSRQRREVSVDNGTDEFANHTRSCCRLEKSEHRPTDEEMDKHDQIRRECENITDALTKNLTADKSRNIMTCFVQCIYEKHNMTNSSGNVLDDPCILSELQRIVDFPERMMKKMSEVCWKISKNNTESEKGKFVCNRMPLHFTICAYDVANGFCPEAQQVKSDECNKLRQTLKATFQI
uniref:Chemosensory protein n=1 Tax=Blattella germanica TaxID=6973 RepID=A0A0X8DBI4_BLAGE|nr:chemosensory protein [Blattella germanica]